MTSTTNPDRILALPYASPADRDAFRALWAFDEILAEIVASTREPMLAEIKLRWWGEQLENERRDNAPILTALTVPLASLTSLVDGWTALLGEPQLTAEALERYATGRGATLFAAIPHGGATSDQLIQCGEGWALTDLAYRCEDRLARNTAFDMARQRLSSAAIGSIKRHSIANAILADLARRDVLDGYPRLHPPGSRRRALRVMRFTLFG